MLRITELPAPLNSGWFSDCAALVLCAMILIKSDGLHVSERGFEIQFHNILPRMYDDTGWTFLTVSYSEESVFTSTFLYSGYICCLIFPY